MDTRWVVFIFSLLSATCGWAEKQRKFKDDFLFGVSTSAYQIEGGWNEDGKGESIWDHHLHKHPEVVIDFVNGDVACDSYHLYKRDVEMLRELGVDFYRFSISWSRVLPTGLPNTINEAGFAYYDNLIDELLKYNIIPMVTLYHFELPQRLQLLGGWSNPLSVQWFQDYAGQVFKRYANKVKYWITINQPSVCMEPYAPPALGDEDAVGAYICVKHILLAHAAAYRLYEKEYKKKYKGQVGISLSLNLYDPVDNRTESEEAAERARQFASGLYLNPIWSKEGGFPSVVKELVAKVSKKEGFPKSRLPEFTEEENKALKGSADFLGMNHYTTFLVYPESEKNVGELWYIGDLDVRITRGEKWEEAMSPWLKSAPYGLYKACLYLNKHYDYPQIIITEHGWSTDTGLNDTGRITVMKEYFKALLLAIEDGTEVKGYSYWSLMDNLEWISGIMERFGLYEVDFHSENKTRTARKSALFYKHTIEKKIIDESWDIDDKDFKIEISDRRMKKKKDEL
ncbi:myrosinase 1-like [Hyposmocoma kahamanoa]|uniref:myrosinase 1-like n=1 Tax=Hyposmocoma kahamanoa TaxID=1477025 RepID=UPI000E6D5E27|nr:myrosinase 1-like [Hyposmocoma kahamanoa]